ncbi:TPA: ogr/Delta-like zinc finger family protein [Enterobacter roggenkampii]|nr:ogr/Delta-like zinc finger family protein [Enterobacter roggenkampii]
MPALRRAGAGQEEVQTRAVAERHPRSSFQVSSETNERYNQCTNIECGHTLVTHETFMRSVCRPQKISAEPPYPKERQEQLAY